LRSALFDLRASVRWPFRHLSKIDQIPSIAPFISWLSTPLKPLQR
jgi:hypothetical protein